MRFEKVRYLDWAKRRFELNPPAYNLAASGMQAATAADLDLADVPLEIAGANAFGHPELRKRIGEMYGVGPEQVLMASGTTTANFLVVNALLSEGMTAACEAPAYEPLWRVLESAGAKIEWVPRGAASGFQPDMARAQKVLADGAKLLVLSNLHNPTGALLDEEVLEELAWLAARKDAWLLVDEVYLTGVFDRPVRSAARLGGRVITTGSLTKTYGLGPLRCGWAIAPEAVVRRAHEIQDHVGGLSSFISDQVALRALDRLGLLRERAVRRRSETWPLVQQFARETKAIVHPPAGAFIAWIGLPDGMSSDLLVDHLTAKYDTLVTPGSFFGVPDHIRISYGLPPELVYEGLSRLSQAIAELGSQP